MLDPAPESRYKDADLMKKFGLTKTDLLIPGALGLLAVVAFVLWIGHGSNKPLEMGFAWCLD